MNTSPNQLKINETSLGISNVTYYQIVLSASIQRSLIGPEIHLWKVPNQCEMLVASNSHWLDTFHVTIMTKFQQIGNYTLKSTQSMWIACCKHYTLIGYFSFSITHIGKNFTHWLGTFQIMPWKVPNQCELLVASITHWLGTFHFQFCFCFCLPKVRLSAPKSDVAELAYSSPEIFANGGSWTKNLLYFRVQLLKNLLGKILHKNQIWWHSISQMSVTVVYLQHYQKHNHI